MRLRWWLTAIPMLAAVAWPGAGAHAQGLSPSEILQQFNAVVFDNFSSTADVEGRTVIGGNLTGGATFALNATAEAASAFAALNVYGSVTSRGNFNLDSAAGAAIAGGNAGSFTLNHGGSVFVGGKNTGNLSVTNGGGNIAVLGSNRGTLSLSNGGSVFVGAANTAGITINNGSSASNSVFINGNNSGYLTLNSGGTVKVNGNAGSGTLNGGSLTYTGRTGSWNLNDGAKASKVASVSLTAPGNPLPAFASTFEQPLVALSNQLSVLTPTSTVLVNGDNLTLEAKPSANGIAVLDLSTSQFQPNDSVSVALNGAKSLIVNLSVAGCSKNCSYTFPSSVNFQNTTSYADSVLWNLTDVSSLSFTNAFGGSVLAPIASVTNTGPINGDLIALKFSGGGELHDYPFTGPLPTPEPSGLAVLAVGLIGADVVRRRRRRSL
ncbi:MAG TPA: collagen-binding domain-containing protein [Acetobacteraceae bacterium]|nr:collagen-binding domain-containing protein [Acetobacteraceae bacterium]